MPDEIPGVLPVALPAALEGFIGRVVIVTGAGSGIGLATAERFLAAGARVVLADLGEEKAEAAIRRSPEARNDNVWCSRCNVAEERDVEATVAGALARYGRLDVVVNNAGRMVFKSIEQHTHQDWTSLPHLTYKVLMACC